MLDFIVNHLSQIGSFVGGICAGAVGGSLVTLKVSRKIRQMDRVPLRTKPERTLVGIS